MSFPKTFFTPGFSKEHGRCSSGFSFAFVIVPVLAAILLPQISVADWELTAVDSAVSSAAMALDSSEAPHLCYFTPEGTHLSGTSGKLVKYATYRAESWTTQTVAELFVETVATKPEDGISCDIKIGSDGMPRIVFVARSAAGSRLAYARWTGSVWEHENIAAGTFMYLDGQCALALDGGDNPHVMYSRMRTSREPTPRTTRCPYYAKKTASGWETQCLDEFLGDPEYAADSAESNNLAISSDGTVYGVWNHLWTMMFAFPRSYDPETLASYQAGMPGRACRLKIDDDDEFNAAGIDRGTGIITCGRNTTDPNPDSSWWFNWNTRQVENCGSTYDAENALHLGMAVDTRPYAHLVFYDAVDRDVKLVMKSLSPVDGHGTRPRRTYAQVSELIDSDGDVGQSPSIALDSLLHQHVAYLDVTNRTVKYGKRHQFNGPQLRVSPSRWNFFQGDLAAHERSHEFCIVNAGDEDLIINDVRIEDTTASGPAATPVWAVNLEDAQQPLGPLPATIGAGGFRTIDVTFRPDVLWVKKTGELSVDSNWGTVAVPLSGKGTRREEDPPDTGYCFIATAAYGSGMAREVTTLRRFRDQCLLPSPLGRIAVEAYYRVSPPIAGVIARSDLLRAAVRCCLRPIVYIAGLFVAP